MAEDLGESSSEEALPAWEAFQAWAEVMGNTRLRALALDEDEEYQTWLRQALAQTGEPKAKKSRTEAEDWTQPDMVPKTVSLEALRADFSRQSGYRAVSPAGLLQKMRDIVLAQEWREWDVAALCEVPELAAAAGSAVAGPATAVGPAVAGLAAAAGSAVAGLAPGAGPKAAEGGTKASEPELPRGGGSSQKPCYLDFHHRGCALHVLAYSFKTRELDLPHWFVLMASAIPISWKGTLTKLEWLGGGLSAAAALQHGQVRLSWLDIIQQVNRDSSMQQGQCLKEKLFSVSPEHAAKLNDWKI